MQGLYLRDPAIERRGPVNAADYQSRTTIPSLPTKYRSEFLTFRLYTLPIQGNAILATRSTVTGPSKETSFEPLVSSCTEAHRPESSKKKCTSATLIQFPFFSTISYCCHDPSVSSCSMTLSISCEQTAFFKDDSTRASSGLSTICPGTTFDICTNAPSIQTRVSAGKHRRGSFGGGEEVPPRPSFTSNESNLSFGVLPIVGGLELRNPGIALAQKRLGRYLGILDQQVEAG